MGLFSGFGKSQWEKAKRRAEKAESSGDLATAMRYYEEAAASCPEQYRGELESRRREAAAKLHETHVEAAEGFWDSGDFASARERWDLALTFAPDQAARDAIEARLRELQSAEITLTEVDPEEEADHEAANIAAAQDDVFIMMIGSLPEELADAYEALDDDFREAFVAAQEGRPEDAVDIYARLVEGSDNPVLHYEYGACLRALDRVDEAVPHLQRAEALEPEWPAVKLELAESYWARERWTEAEEVLQRAADVASDDPEVLQAIARHSLLTRSPESGLEATEIGLEFEPLHRGLMLLRGQLFEIAEQYDKAVECYETLVERYWRYDHQEDRLNFDRDAGLLASRLYVRRNQNLDRAEELMRAAIHVTPTRARWPLEIQLAEVLFQADKKEEAEELLGETLHHIPDEELLWRIRLAELLGDQERVDYLLPELDDEQRRIWDEMHERD